MRKVIWHLALFLCLNWDSWLICGSYGSHSLSHRLLPMRRQYSLIWCVVKISIIIYVGSLKSLIYLTFFCGCFVFIWDFVVMPFVWRSPCVCVYLLCCVLRSNRVTAAVNIFLFVWRSLWVLCLLSLFLLAVSFCLLIPLLLWSTYLILYWKKY